MFQSLINQAANILNLNPISNSPQRATFEVNKNFHVVVELRNHSDKKDVQFRITAHEKGDRKAQHEHIKELRRSIKQSKKPDPWYPLHGSFVDSFLTDQITPSWVAVWKINAEVEGEVIENFKLKNGYYVESNILPMLKEAVKNF